MKKVAINGFGRIGRLFYRQSFQHKKFDVVAVNDLGDLDNLAYLLKFDSVYRAFPEEVKVKRNPNGIGGEIAVGKEKIMVLQEKDPTKLPWKDLGIDIVIESTGVFESFEKASVHLASGAKRVVLTAPAKDADGVSGGKTILVGGGNGAHFKNCNITSNGSCTTNATFPVAAVLSENPGIVKAILNTVHGYTATQTLTDSPTKGKDFRRGRAAAENITPSTTGAAIAVTRVIPELTGKFDGISMRVPVVTGSVVDFTFLAKRKTSAEEINDILRKAAAAPAWKGILKVSDDQLVSSDIIGEPFGAIVDSEFTKVVDGDLVKVLSWYDNEAGYVSTLIRHVELAASAL